MVTKFNIHCFIHEDVAYFRWSANSWYVEVGKDLILLDVHGFHMIEKEFQSYMRKQRLKSLNGLLEE